MYWHSREFLGACWTDKNGYNVHFDVQNNFQYHWWVSKKKKKKKKRVFLYKLRIISRRSQTFQNKGGGGGWQRGWPGLKWFLSIDPCTMCHSIWGGSRGEGLASDWGLKPPPQLRLWILASTYFLLALTLGVTKMAAVKYEKDLKHLWLFLFLNHIICIFCITCSKRAKV